MQRPMVVPPRDMQFDDVQFCVQCMCPSSHVDMGQFDQMGRFFCSPGCMVQFSMDHFSPCPMGAQVFHPVSGQFQRCHGQEGDDSGDSSVRCPHCENAVARRQA